MSNNPLIQLQKFGQSFWYDNISRDIIHSGKLKRMIEEYGLRGVTSNPTIFHKALKESREYEEQLIELINKGLSSKEIFYEIAITDIRDACDLLENIFVETKGDDGYVSIEVDPHLAYDREATIEEATELFERVGRPNVMIKVPATLEGLGAIEELIYRGVNVNVTLLFSPERYQDVIDAYLKGLDRRMQDERPLDKVASVASFFVSRIDTLVDRLLTERAEKDPENADKIKMLLGKAGVSSAKVAYEVFVKGFSTERFLVLRMRGAKVQRLLFGSTSTKNPDYSDILYVENLIGPGTVNTMPEETWKAFLDHGEVRRTLDEDLDKAKEVLKEIERLGINMEKVYRQLEEEGVKKFQDSFDAILSLIDEKRKNA